jgi:hypothetical protein
LCNAHVGGRSSARRKREMNVTLNQWRVLLMLTLLMKLLNYSFMQTVLVVMMNRRSWTGN